TKITIDITVATAVKKFLENYAEIHGLPSPGRNINRIIQSLTPLPAETSYKLVYRDFIAGLENDSTLKLLKYDAFRKLWHQLTPYIQIMSPRTDLCDTCQHFRNGLQCSRTTEDDLVTGGKIYYLSPHEIIGKDPNGTLSMVFDGIRRLNK
ncbi:14274_t:CDS:2, partial [Ambispora leptoticha]